MWINSNFHTGPGPSRQKTEPNLNVPFRRGAPSRLSHIATIATIEDTAKEAFDKKFNWLHSSKRSSEDLPSTYYVLSTVLNISHPLFLWVPETVQFFYSV